MVFNVVGMLAKLIFVFFQAQDFSSVFVSWSCRSYGLFTLCHITLKFWRNLQITKCKFGRKS